MTSFFNSKYITYMHTLNWGAKGYSQRCNLDLKNVNSHKKYMKVYKVIKFICTYIIKNLN